MLDPATRRYGLLLFGTAVSFRVKLWLVTAAQIALLTVFLVWIRPVLF